MAAPEETKLEHCEVCANNKAKYTCPKCEVRTCCLSCVNIHKTELECDGIRDKTKFIPLKKFTDLDLLSDYRMLEGIGRNIEQLKTNPVKKYTKQRELPPHLYKLRSAAFQRGTFLHLMPQNFSRHKENTTQLNFKSNQIFWRIEWFFPQSENLKFISERVCENDILADVVTKIWNPIDDLNETDIEIISQKLSLRNKLQFYAAADVQGVKILLKAEKVKNSKRKFFELDAELSLKENFEKRHIIEFPTIHVVLKDHCDMYTIVDSDEEVVELSEDESQQPVRPRNKFSKHKQFRTGVKRKRPDFAADKVKSEPQVKTETATRNFFFDNDDCDNSE